MRNQLVFTLFFGVLMFVVTACNDNRADAVVREKLPFAVKTQSVEWQTTGIAAEYSGSISAARKAMLSTRVMGVIESIAVREGETVSSGQVLLRLRSKDIAAKKSQAEAMAREAENNYQNARRQLERIETLFTKSAVTRKELDDTRMAGKNAEARLEAARQSVKEAEEALRYSQITAPFSGVVTRKMANRGDFVNPGQPLMEVSNLGELEVVTKISASEIAQLKVGQQAQIIIPAVADNHRISGQVARIVPAADQLSRQFEVIFRVENPNGSLKPGMFARVNVAAGGAARLLLPRRAVLRRGQLQGVYVLDSQQVIRLRWIRTGLDFGENVEVLSGLDHGARVVVDRIDELIDGSLAEVER